jgi:thiamine-phosphate pyrophosphorylase
VQLRLKEVKGGAVRPPPGLKPLPHDRGAFMNDRPDLAGELDCDGVHVGEEDMPYAEARRLLGPDRIVGVTCGASRDRAITAAEAGADFLAVIGAIWSHPGGPRPAVREFNEVFARYGRAFADTSS